MLRRRLGVEPIDREQVYLQAAQAAVSASLPAAEVDRSISDGTRLTDQALRALVGEGIDAGPAREVPAGIERAPPVPPPEGELAPPGI